MWSHDLYIWFICRYGEKRVLHGLTTFAMNSTGDAFKKINSSLNLIDSYAPEKLKSMTNDIADIVVAGIPTSLGSYIPEKRRVVLNEELIKDEFYTTEEIACTLIHEAQHARLFRLGFGFEADNWWRIEKICYTAQRNFARRLPTGEDQVADAESALKSGPAFHISKAKAQSDYDLLTCELEDHGFPDWLISILGRRYRRRIAQMKE